MTLRDVLYQIEAIYQYVPDESLPDASDNTRAFRHIEDALETLRLDIERYLLKTEGRL